MDQVRLSLKLQSLGRDDVEALPAKRMVMWPEGENEKP